MSGNKITIESYHKNLWKCRDFEIQNLWQRSIFLTTFMLLTFTGYGTVLLKIIELATSPYGADIISSTGALPQNAQLTSVGDNKDYLNLLNIIAQSICILGMLFSILWIMMGKGSKGWYEVYEQAIGAFERDSDNTDFSNYGGFQYARLPNYEGVELDDDILTTKAGAYSPSKINTAIGIVTLFTWGILIIFHIALSFVDFNLSALNLKSLSFFMPLVASIVICLFLLYAKKSLKSGALDNYRG